MSRKYIILTVSSFLFIVVFAYVLPALAFDIEKGIVGNLNPSCREYGNCGFCDFVDLFIVLQKVILSLFGGLALIMIIWGGSGIITSAGNSQKMAEGKKLIFSTLLGVLIILAGYFLISVLVAILVTPAGQKPALTLFNEEWRQGFCKPSTDSGYCGERGDGATCTVKSGSNEGTGVCSGGKCITLCDQKHASSGYSCKIITSCEKHSDIQGKYANCNATNLCYTQLCPGKDTADNKAYVCCK